MKIILKSVINSVTETIKLIKIEYEEIRSMQMGRGNPITKKNLRH